MGLRNGLSEDAPPARPPVGDQDVGIVLKPQWDSTAAEIRIEDDLVAVGRNEPPFAAYGRERVAEMSRRHARIFVERGAVYVADLGSKNGTTVNGQPVRQKPLRLKDGDRVGFGGELSFRVALNLRPRPPASAARQVRVTLMPERKDLGLQPIVITGFPFLVSKADEAFARYRAAYPHQVNYVSRRHAHIFLKGGTPWLEDLGSTNGTFVGEARLDEHAVALQEGDVIAFGGRHFVYRVNIQEESEATLTRLASAEASAGEATADDDKTTFVAAADSFLDIFCIDAAPSPEDEVNQEEAAPEREGGEGEERRPRPKWMILAGELRQAFGGGEGPGPRRWLPWAGGAAAVVAVLAIWLYFAGAAERDARALLARGDYPAAADVAHRHLAGHPDDATMQALGAEALLKGSVPGWLALLKAGDFDGAAAALAQMKAQAAVNADVLTLVAELEWVTELQRFVAQRGGLDAPIRLFADEARIKALIQRWEQDPGGHQRALARIAVLVPEFRDPYALTMSQLRKLESDDSVYLAAIERLTATVTAELAKGGGELEAVLQEYGEKYPRLAGLDALRQDLLRYRRLDEALRERRLGPILARMEGLQLATPPFQQALERMRESRLPPPEVVQRHAAVTEAWNRGAGEEAIAGLQALAGGPWADTVAEELAHKKAVAEQFKALQQARGGKDYEDRLLNFYGALDAQADGYFLHAIEADVAVSRSKALARAQAQLARAQGLWQQYRQAGGIGGEQRLEAGISPGFRSQARLLAAAQEDARQGVQTLTLLEAGEAAKWKPLQQEIQSEADMQRRSLEDLRTVLEPNLVKAKLALIGGRSDEE